MHSSLFTTAAAAVILLIYLAGSVLFSLNNTNPVKPQFEQEIEEAIILDLQQAFISKKLTSRKLVDFYLERIKILNPLLRGVIEVNPDAPNQADESDRIRERLLLLNDNASPFLGDLHGIPVLLKDSIATKDKLNTSAGSYALLGSKVPQDAGVVEKLRNAGAVILGKASMGEWYQMRDLKMPPGWCARSGQGVNPYVQGGSPCGSSSGSAIAVAANMVAVSLGTDTGGSIPCPADYNSIVGIRPTVGLTSRSGVIPASHRQDTIGPMCRTVSDAVYVLDAIVGFDPRDSEATKEAAKFIPVGGYKQFLKKNGLKGKRLGIVRDPFLELSKRSLATEVLEKHLHILREGGAIVIDNLEIFNVNISLNPYESGSMMVLLAEFKTNLNQYLQGLISSSVRSLSDIIEFNKNNPHLEHLDEYSQETLIAAESTNGIGEKERKAVVLMEKLSNEGFEKLMLENELDAMVTIGSEATVLLAFGGHPAITVPAGYDKDGMPFGMFFGGYKGTEPTLIEIAYAFEQATMIRKPPPLLTSFQSS